jgi:hypothetical protein
MPVRRQRATCEHLAQAVLDRDVLPIGPDLLRIAVWLLEAGMPPERRTVSFAAAARRALQDDDPALAERLARAGLDGDRADALALEKQGRHDEVATAQAQVWAAMAGRRPSG